LRLREHAPAVWRYASTAAARGPGARQARCPPHRAHGRAQPGHRRRPRARSRLCRGPQLLLHPAHCPRRSCRMAAPDFRAGNRPPAGRVLARAAGHGRRAPAQAAALSLASLVLDEQTSLRTRT
nr:hypothetical protein [Tanacetum cinerariifolium]